jgi:hypothetical protein
MLEACRRPWQSLALTPGACRRPMEELPADARGAPTPVEELPRRPGHVETAEAAARRVRQDVERAKSGADGAWEDVERANEGAHGDWEDVESAARCRWAAVSPPRPAAGGPRRSPVNPADSGISGRLEGPVQVTVTVGRFRADRHGVRNKARAGEGRTSGTIRPRRRPCLQEVGAVESRQHLRLEGAGSAGFQPAGDEVPDLSWASPTSRQDAGAPSGAG